MYVTAQDNRAFALDAATGRQLWRYQRKLPEKVNGANRGFAALGDKLFMATLDAHVIALDQKTGRVVWDVESEDRKKGYFFTISPLAVKDKIIVGVSGGENGIRGYIEAYEPDTGKRAWRFYTIPGPGEKGHDSWYGDSWKTGGAPAWMAGTYVPSSIVSTGKRPTRRVISKARSEAGTTCTVAVLWRSMPTQGSCAGISSSRHMMCTTGTRTRCRCSSISSLAVALGS
jgi:hypothetical protein